MFSQLNDDMPFAFAIQDGMYGYKKTDGTFKSFRSQSDVDGAIADAMIGTATSAQVLVGYTFTNSEASDIDGTMPNQGSKQYTINPGGQQSIPKGYHDGTGYVKANPNQNSTTYTFSSGSGGTVDLGVNNTVRYVNASNVYNYGYASGQIVPSGYTLHVKTNGGKGIVFGSDAVTIKDTRNLTNITLSGSSSSYSIDNVFILNLVGRSYLLINLGGTAYPEDSIVPVNCINNTTTRTVNFTSLGYYSTYVNGSNVTVSKLQIPSEAGYAYFYVESPESGYGTSCTIGIT